jgi:hypothetical protein
MDILNDAAQANFHQRLIVFLREQIPDETAEFTDEALMERIIQSEDRASTYGIITDHGISQFVLLTFMAGPDFDEVPEVNAYLTEPSDAPDERLNELVEEIIELGDE